jgi:hypothetical protein
MNRRDAKEKSRSGDISIGELRALIAKARDRGGMSRVNGSITLAQACGIYAAALERRPDDEKPAGMKIDPYSTVGALKPTRDALTIQNILRDCA